MRSGFSDKQNKSHSKRHNTVLEILKKKRVTSVLDFGCGDGQFLELLSNEKIFKKLIGIDHDKKSLKLAGKYLGKNKNVSLFLGRLIDLKNYSGIEAVVLIEVIEHFSKRDLKSLETELFNRLHPRVIVITTPRSLKGIVGGVRTAKELRVLGHKFEWTEEEFTLWGRLVSSKYNYSCDIKVILGESFSRGTQVATFFDKGK